VYQINFKLHDGIKILHFLSTKQLATTSITICSGCCRAHVRRKEIKRNKTCNWRRSPSTSFTVYRTALQCMQCMRGATTSCKLAEKFYLITCCGSLDVVGIAHATKQNKLIRLFYSCFSLVHFTVRFTAQPR